MKIHECEQGTLRWLEFHIGLPTASGLDNMLTPEFELRKGEMPRTYVHKKIGEAFRGKPQIQLGSSGSFETEQGMILEDEAIPFYELETGEKVTRVGFITDDDGKVGCSPDGLIYDRGLPDKRGIEIKCPAVHTHVKYLIDGVLPKEYRVQVHASMFVTGFESWEFVSYRRGFPPLILTVKCEPAFQEAIRKAVMMFHDELSVGLEKIRWLSK